MTWDNDVYYYRIGTLKAITYNYEALYSDAHLAKLFEVAEFKADFDLSLRAIGKGEWRGLTSQKFEDYRQFGKQQRAVIADILNIPDYKLKGWGFYQVPQLRGQAYARMVDFLNNYGVAKINRSGVNCKVDEAKG